MRVLVVAPESDLDHARDEVEEVVRALGAVALMGEVTTRLLLLHFAPVNGRPRRWDVLWFAAHGSGEGVSLSNGELLTTARLIQDARNCGARLVVLNSCDSEDVALRLHHELRIDVICTVTEVPDLDAYRTGTYLAQRLAEGMSVRDAYERAQPGRNRLYLHLQGEVEMGGSFNDNEMRGDIRGQLEEIRMRLVRFEEKQAHVQDDVAEIKARLKNGNGHGHHGPQWGPWAFNLNSLLLLVLVLAIAAILFGGHG